MKRERHERRHDGKDRDDDNDLSSSQSSEDSDTGRRKKSKDKTRKRHRESSQSRKKHKKHKKSDRHSRRHRHEESSASESDGSRDRRKKKKKEKRKRRKSEKHSHRGGKRRRVEAGSSGDESSASDVGKKKPKSLDLEVERNHKLASALRSLLEARPVFAGELPLILIRMAGGATFDLSQMTDVTASRGLEAVFEALGSFGVQKNQDAQSWMFQSAPSGSGSRVNRNELVLLRLVRALLDGLGFTMEAVTDYERKLADSSTKTTDHKRSHNEAPKSTDISQDEEELQTIRELTHALLKKFDKSNSTLADELRGICTSIAQGECISLDGLPDTNLEKALDALFKLCGLQLSEMDNDDESEDGNAGSGGDDDDEAIMGFALPEGGNEAAQIRLAAVMHACRKETLTASKAKAPARGPMREKDAKAYNPSSVPGGQSGDDDEGPVPFGATARRERGPAMHPDLVKAQADRRQLELAATAAGVAIPSSKEGEREEWMLVPGKHDFLSSIKSGNPTKSRGFQNKKQDSRGNKVEAPVHPAIQAEIDAIMNAHSNARGPSLIDQHRAKKEMERQSKSGKSTEWKWSRDKDLDAGRRVDKDALSMVLGGAADNLKDKFQRSHHR